MATHPEALGRELGGCPVMHRDFAPDAAARAATGSWPTELREASPVYFNTYAQGYWVFTRHDAVRDIYKTPELFSSESITPWQPDPIYRFVPTQIDAPGPHQVPPDRQPVVLAAGDRRGGGQRCARSAAGWSRRSPRRAAATSSPSSRCASPPRRSSSVSGIDPSDADLFVPWVEDFFSGFGGDPAGLEAMAQGARRHPRLLGRRAGGAPRGPGAARGRPRLAPAARHLRRPPAHRRRAARHADGAGAGRARHDARAARLPVPASRGASRAPPPADRRAGADPVRGRGGPALLHDHLRRRPQGDARRRVPRRAAQAGRHGLRARSPEPTATRARTSGPTSSSSTASATTTWASRTVPIAASARTSRGARCSSRSRSGCG